MLLETAVDKARGNLSSAARMLGITRPQIAYRLKRLQEGTEAAGGSPPGPFDKTHTASA
jgi:transcriptional regulator with GAF, ATPase, and Fis domain